MNKIKQITAAILALATITLTSCLDDNTDGYTYTDDTAITAFTLGTLKYTAHTKSKAGTDSVYQTTRDCSSTKFYIDNNSRAIWNADSLPCGTDITKVVCTISAKNSGTVVIQSMTSDSLSYYSSTDSIDFSQPRKVRVYSNSGQVSREYTITVNVHHEYADSMTWANTATTPDFATLDDMRALQAGGYIFLLGQKDGATSLWRTTDGTQWTACQPNFNHQLPAGACHSAVVKGQMLYLSDSGNIIRTADGDNWQQTAAATPAARLVAATEVRLYAYTTAGELIESTDDGATWTTSTLDDDATLLPTDNLATITTALKTNAGAYRATIIGTNTAGTTVTWSKIDEADEAARQQPWTYYNTEPSRHTLPTLQRLQVSAYDGGMLAAGQNGSTLDSLRMSYDGALTWNADTLMTLPAAMDKTTKPFAMTTSTDGHIYIITAADGRTWKGRLNRVAWKDDEKQITE